MSQTDNSSSGTNPYNIFPVQRGKTIKIIHERSRVVVFGCEMEHTLLVARSSRTTQLSMMTNKGYDSNRHVCGSHEQAVPPAKRTRISN